MSLERVGLLLLQLMLMLMLPLKHALLLTCLLCCLQLVPWLVASVEHAARQHAAG